MDPILIGGFKGRNNKLPAHRVPGPGADNPIVALVTGQNFDIDNSNRAFLRPGYANILAISGLHSGFSALGYFLFVKDGTLYRFFPETLAYMPLIAVGSDNDMHYWTAVGRVFFTNGTVIGEMKDGVANLFPETTTRYKVKLPAGQTVAYFKGRLYVAKDNILWISDVKPFYRTDLRHGFKQFPERILRIAPTTDGIYVGTEKRVYYLGGFNPLKMTVIPVTATPIKDLPPIYIESEKINGLKADGVFPIIPTDDGINIGLPSGNLENLTGNEYVLPSGSKGTAILRTDDTFQCHYIIIYQGEFIERELAISGQLNQITGNIVF